MFDKIKGLKEEIEGLKEEIKDLKARSNAELEDLRIRYLSKKGKVSELFNYFRDIPADMKR